jgi:hypothetical protein
MEKKKRKEKIHLAEIREEENKVFLVVDGKKYDMGQAQTTGIPKEWGYSFAQDMIDRGYKNKGEYVLSLMIQGYQSVHEKENIVSTLEKELKETKDSLANIEQKLSSQQASINNIIQYLLTFPNEDLKPLIEQRSETIQGEIRSSGVKEAQWKSELNALTIRLENDLNLTLDMLNALCKRDRHIDLDAIYHKGGRV